jgi:hypothetical protein
MTDALNNQGRGVIEASHQFIHLIVLRWHSFFSEVGILIDSEHRKAVDKFQLLYLHTPQFKQS